MISVIFDAFNESPVGDYSRYRDLIASLSLLLQVRCVFSVKISLTYWIGSFRELPIAFRNHLVCPRFSS